MTDSEKIAALDMIALAITNLWADGKWSWFCVTPSGGPVRDTREEAVLDFVAWAKRISSKDAGRFKINEACREAGEEFYDAARKRDDKNRWPISLSMVEQFGPPTDAEEQKQH